MADREPNPDPAAAHGQPSPEAHVQLRFEKFSSFVEEYWPKISLRGMLLETTQPKPVGTMISFEFKLTDGFRLCQGVGEVAWVRRRDEGPQGPAGMGIRFHALDDQGRELILKILEEQVKSGGEPFEIERVPPGAESEPAPPAPRESAEPEPPAAEQGWVRPPPREVERKQPPPTEPLEPAAAAAAPADGGFQAPWEKLPEPSDVLDPLDDSSVSAEAEMEVDSDSALAGFPRRGTNGGFPRRGTNGGFPRRGTNGGFPLDPDSSETELQEADDEPLLLFAADETEEGEALPIDETVAERVEFDPFGGEASEPALSFDLDEPSPELEAPIELAGEELAPADWPDVSGEEPTILLSKIDDLAGEDRPPSLEADAEIQFDAESSAVFLDLDTSAEELTTPLLRDAGGAVQEVLEEAAAIPEFDGIGDDAPDVLGSRPDDELAEGPAVSPEPESRQLAEIEVAPSPPPELAPEAESLPPFAEIESAPEPESPPPFAEIEAAPEPESPPPFPDVEVPPEAESPPLFPDVEVPPEAGSAESPLPFAEIEVAPEPSASPAPEEAEVTATPVAAASSFLDRTASRLPAEDTSEDGEAWEEEEESGPRLFLRDIKLAIAESRMRIAVAVVLLGLAVAGYHWYDEILQMVGFSSPSTVEVTEAPLAAAPEDPEAAPVPVEPALGSGDSGPEVRVVEPQLSDSPPATPQPAREPARLRTEPSTTRTQAATRATQVTRISHQQTATGTLVTIQLDGDLAADRYQHSELGYDPLKEALTIHGIEAPYRSQIAVGTRELQQIRIGFHPGNELKLVFDLSSREMAVAEIRNRGDRLEVLVSSR